MTNAGAGVPDISSGLLLRDIDRHFVGFNPSCGQDYWKRLVKPSLANRIIGLRFTSVVPAGSKREGSATGESSANRREGRSRLDAG
jgi:hypothetical protein